jgi:hypothetical protein
MIVGTCFLQGFNEASCTSARHVRRCSPVETCSPPYVIVNDSSIGIGGRRGSSKAGRQLAAGVQGLWASGLRSEPDVTRDERMKSFLFTMSRLRFYDDEGPITVRVEGAHAMPRDLCPGADDANDDDIVSVDQGRADDAALEVGPAFRNERRGNQCGRYRFCVGHSRLCCSRYRWLSARSCWTSCCRCQPCGWPHRP